MKVPIPYDSKNTPLDLSNFLNHYNQLVAYVVQKNELDFKKLEQRIKKLEKIIEEEKI